MNRRTLLTGLAGAAATVAGCGGSGGTETPQALRYPEYAFEEDEDGNTVVVLTVENPDDRRREGTLNTKIRGKDEELLTVERSVTLEPLATETYRLSFDVEWAWFDENRNLQGVEFE